MSEKLGALSLIAFETLIIEWHFWERKLIFTTMNHLPQPKSHKIKDSVSWHLKAVTIGHFKTGLFQDISRMVTCGECSENGETTANTSTSGLELVLQSYRARNRCTPGNLFPIWSSRRGHLKWFKCGQLPTDISELSSILWWRYLNWFGGRLLGSANLPGLVNSASGRGQLWYRGALLPEIESESWASWNEKRDCQPIR